MRYPLALLLFAVAAGTAGAAEHPNVLFIAVDDLKPVLGCYDDPYAKSPNIDALAGRGTTFLNAHCQQAVCGPSRASLLTGLRPDTTRVWDLQTRLRDNLPDVVTLPQHFKNNGYHCVGIGKIFDPRSVDGQKKMDVVSWSEPYLWPDSPANASFGYLNPKTVKAIEEGLPKAKAAGIKGWQEIQQYIGCRPPTDMADVPDDAYDDGAFAEEGARQIKKLARGDQPFFLAVGFKKPHLPFCAPKKYWDMYDPAEFEIAKITALPTGAPEFHYQDSWELRSGYTDIPDGMLPESMQRQLIHGYYACTSYTDAQIGKLIQALDEAGVADNTAIVLWGDHGWHLGDHGMWCKHTNYEQATRAPLVFCAPNQKVAGGKSKSPVEFVDIFPTLCELTGLDAPAGLHGTSLTPVLDDPSVTVKQVAVSQYPRHREGEVMGYSFRNDRYRLIQWYPFNKKKPDVRGSKKLVATELYDYQTDPLETRNLADDPAYAEALAEMEQLASDYWQSQATPAAKVAAQLVR